MESNSVCALACKQSAARRCWSRLVEILLAWLFTAPSQQAPPNVDTERDTFWRAVVDLFADAEAADRLIRFTSVVTVGVVLIAAIAGAVVIVHPEVMQVFGG